MILQSQQYSDTDINQYLPLIKSSLTFFDEHYQQQQLLRSTKALDETGHLVLYPGSAAETYKITYNSVTTVAGLSAVLTALLQLPNTYMDTTERARWQAMLSRIPPFAYRQMQGHTTLAASCCLGNASIMKENTQLYPVFPYGQFGIGKPGLDTAINTWKYDTEAAKMKSFVGWKQDNIWCARLGLTDEAAAITLKKLANSGKTLFGILGTGL